jgi:hypothetical protein
MIFSWWWIVFGGLAVFAGVFVGVIMVMVMKRKGRIALFMCPLLAFQLLWASWNEPRHELLVDWWFNQNDYSGEYFPALFVPQYVFFWIFVILALVPALAKDKLATDE